MPPTTASTTASSRTQKRGNPTSRASARASRHASQESLPAPQTHELLAGPSVNDRVRLRAYDLYERRGRIEGRALDDWLAAEAELRGD